MASLRQPGGERAGDDAEHRGHDRNRKQRRRYRVGRVADRAERIERHADNLPVGEGEQQQKDRDNGEKDDLHEANHACLVRSIAALGHQRAAGRLKPVRPRRG